MDKRDSHLDGKPLRNLRVSLNMQSRKEGQRQIIGRVYSMNDNTFIKKVNLAKRTRFEQKSYRNDVLITLRSAISLVSKKSKNYAR